MGYIYKIFNDINDKVYIGKTTRNLKVRFQEHLSEVRGHSLLHKAIQKYGETHFFIEEIGQYPDSELNEKESYWIDYYNSFIDGYNLTTGGDGGTNLSKEQIQLIRKKWEEGKIASQIAKELNISHSTVYHRIAAYQDFSKKQNRERIAQLYARPVNQYNFEGILLHSFNSFKEAADFINGDINGIFKACKHRGVYLNYYWRYAEENFLYKDSIRKHPINEYNIMGKYITTYPSARAASIARGINRSNITRAATGKSVSAGGFIYIYIKDVNENLLQEKIKKYQITERYRSGRKIRCIETGKTYNSISEAQAEFGKIHISEACLGIRKTAGGYHWKYE